MAGCVAGVVEHLSSKCEAPSSNPSTTKKGRKGGKKEEKKGQLACF
jgi:hypothetical protein